MSEVMISRRGSGDSIKYNGYITEYITESRNWIMPNYIKNNQIKVTAFGGGGAGGYSVYYSSGCSGYLNNDTFTIIPNQVIPITVKSTLYQRESTGDTVSFGTYLSANGGSLLIGGSGGNNYSSNATQFGAGGGSAGVYGGGRGGNDNSSGGNGGLYGGGGGGGNSYYKNSSRSGYYVVGGNGGTYGGGGGGGSIDWYGGNRPTDEHIAGGIAGTYGGNGGNGSIHRDLNVYITDAEDGINTFTWTNIAKDDITGEYFRGWGMKGYADNTSFYSGAAGGGGYGGNGGNGSNDGCGGGGGGYGSNGGHANKYYGGGGGGGYGGDGGIGGGSYAGGGGGYGKASIGGVGSGGGYYCPGGGINHTGGGGGIGIWDGNMLVASFGSGGIIWNYSNLSNQGDTTKRSEPGIVILQYYLS